MLNLNDILKTKIESRYSAAQLSVLILLRLVIGYHFLYEGFDKILSSTWTSAGFLKQANWIFAGFFHTIADSLNLLIFVDNINIWLQLIIGLFLVTGLFTRTAAIIGAVLITLYYVAIPPFVQNYIFIDKNLLEIFGLLVLALFRTSDIIGLDRLLKKFRS